MRLRGFLFLILIVAFGLVSMVGQILGLYIDWLWFREVQFTSVFLTVLRTQVILGAVTVAAFFLILYITSTCSWPGGSLRAMSSWWRTTPSGCPAEVLEPYIRRLALPVSAVLALFVGWVGTGRLETTHRIERKGVPE